MTMPSELELEMVAAVFLKELDCGVEFNRGKSTITVQMPWFRLANPLNPCGDNPPAGYIS